MKSTILVMAAIAAALFVTPAIAADCSKSAPYYHTTHADSPGSIMADVFFLPFTVGVTVLASPTVAIDGGTTFNKALCGPVNHGKRIAEKAPQLIPKVIQNFN